MRLNIIISCLTVILCFTLPQITAAQKVKYTYKPLAKEGCSMQYSVARQDSNYYIVVTMTSDNMTFLKTPTFLIKTFKGDVIKLLGMQISNKNETTGVIVNNLILPISEVNSSAQFPISENQLELLKDGIAKVRLSTTPYEHKRYFKKDKIGKKIYSIYLKKKFDNF